MLPSLLHRPGMFPIMNIGSESQYQQCQFCHQNSYKLGTTVTSIKLSLQRFIPILNKVHFSINFRFFPFYALSKSKASKFQIHLEYLNCLHHLEDNSLQFKNIVTYILIGSFKNLFRAAKDTKVKIKTWSELRHMHKWYRKAVKFSASHEWKRKML